MKRALSIILSIIMIVCAFPAFPAYAESTFEDGVLTISGTGGVGGFSHRDDIIKVIINEGITNIADSAFSYCKNLKEVYFPESLEVIHKYSFTGCKKLEKADLPSQLRIIGVRAFYGCDLLKKIELPDSLEEIYATAFYGCNAAAGKLVIPKNVKILQRYAFSHCDSLTEVSFEEGFTFGESTGNSDRTFNDCANLQSVYIPGSVKELPSSCFVNCPKLKKINLCEGVEIVGGFNDATSLEKITLPKSTKRILSGAFQGCTKLKTVKIQGKLDWIEGLAFANCDSLKMLKIPYGVDKVDQMFCGYNYTFDEEKQVEVYTKIKNYKIYGKKCKALTDYCKENGFKFIDMYDVSNATAEMKSQTYNGSAKKPSVTVKLAGTTLKKDTDYTIKYSNNTKVGTAKVTLTGIGKYKGTLEKTFKINPKPTELTKLTAGSKSFKAFWKKNTVQTSGYQIQYSTYKDLKNAKTVTITSYKTGARTIKNLKAKKNYFVRIRTYKIVSGKKYYSKWSEHLKVTTK